MGTKLGPIDHVSYKDLTMGENLHHCDPATLAILAQGGDEAIDAFMEGFGL